MPLLTRLLTLLCTLTSAMVYPPPPPPSTLRPCFSWYAALSECRAGVAGAGAGAW